MPLADFLTPGENIRYRSPTRVEYQDDDYDLYITDRRIIWHKQEGMVFKKDKLVSEKLENVSGINYEEKGLFGKRGIIQIRMGRRKLEFSGSPTSIRAIYSEMQALM